MSTHMAAQTFNKPVSDLIAALYRIAIEPEKHFILHDLWEEYIISPALEGEKVDTSWFPEVTQHIKLASKVFEERERPIEKYNIEDSVFPTIICDNNLRIKDKNSLAKLYYGPQDIKFLTELDLSPKSKEILLNLLRPQNRIEGEAHLITFHDTLGQEKHAILKMEKPADWRAPHQWQITGLQVGWSKQLSTIFRTKFSLSPSEIEILEQLLMEQPVRDIAIARQTKEITVRSQIKSIYQKISTSGKHGLIGVIACLNKLIPHISNKEQHHTSRSLDFLALKSGQPIRYKRFGKLGGTPCLMIHSTTSVHCSSAFIEQASIYNLDVISVEVINNSAPTQDNLISHGDYSKCDEIMAHFGHAEYSLVCCYSAGVYGLEICASANNNIKNLYLLNIGYPFKDIQEYKKMPPLMRRTRVSSNVFPEGLTLPFKIVGEFLPKQSAGNELLINFHFSENTSDLQLLKGTQLYHAEILKDLRAAYSYIPFLTGAYHKWSSDWSSLLEQAQKNCSITIIHGQDHQVLPLEDIENFYAAYPKIALKSVPGADLILYQSPDQICKIIG